MASQFWSNFSIPDDYDRTIFFKDLKFVIQGDIINIKVDSVDGIDTLNLFKMVVDRRSNKNVVHLATVTCTLN